MIYVVACQQVLQCFAFFLQVGPICGFAADWFAGLPCARRYVQLLQLWMGIETSSLVMLSLRITVGAPVWSTCFKIKFEKCKKHKVAMMQFARTNDQTSNTVCQTGILCYTPNNTTCTVAL
jgi:hypothetical protein